LSSTLEIPEAGEVPRHIAIILDGNGRWARRRHLPRFAGHKRGVEAVRRVVRACAERGVGFLTLFAFSSENWRRPPDEVALLMQLFVAALTREVRKLHRNEIRLKVIGDHNRFESDVARLVDEAVAKTAGNTRMTLAIALNYGGRGELVKAMRGLADQIQAGTLAPAEIDEARIEACLDTHDLPPLDLLIRTSGEQRLSNFLLWQAAYAELLFVDTLWPDFDGDALRAALGDYARRERRYGGL